MIRKKINSGENLLTVSKKQETNLNFFWYGFAVFIVFYGLASSEATFITPVTCQVFQILGFIFMALGAFSLMRFKFDNKYLQTLFTLNLIYSLTVVLRGSQYDFESLKQMFLDITFGVLPYIASLVLLLSRNIGFYKKIYTVLLILGGCFVINVFIFYDVLHDYDRLNMLSQGMVESFSVLMGLPIGFLLLNYPYFAGKKELYGIGKKNIFASIVMIVALFFAIFRARRGLIFMNLSTLACVGMIYIISTKKKFLIIFMAVFLTGVGSLFISDIKLPSMFGFLMERGEEDTRSGVEDWLYADMSPTDWVIGKGIKGKYYCPIVENINDTEGGGFRDNIETGYLQIILKGGVISLGLLLFIFVPAVYKGLFKSRNVLSKASAMWVFLWIIYLYPSGGILFTMNYLLVWIAVGICYSDKIRDMSDDTIKKYLQD